jgi:hypothetical protein
MKKAILFFIGLCITVILQAQVQMTLRHASKAPVIDGYIDDVDDPWGALIPLTVRNPASTTSGMTAKFQILTSSDAFYVAVVVEDATPSNDATAIVNSYERDCSEIFFSMDTVTKPDGAYKTGCWQIRTQREGEDLVDGNSGANTWSVSTLTADPNFKVASETSATEYIQELVLPYSILTAEMEPAWNYQFFRFDIAVADNTTGVAGGRTEQRYWYGHNGLGDDHEWDNTKSLAIVKLPACCGTDRVKKGENLRIYPNPVTEGFCISGLEDKTTVQLADLDGKLKISKEVKGNETISVRSLPKGVYIVRITARTGIVERKLVKE